MSNHSWLEARFRLPTAQQGRALGRSLRRQGALKLMQQGPEMISLWSREDSLPGRLADLAAEHHLDPPRMQKIQAADPAQAWSSPRPIPLGPGLSMAPAWMGLAASKKILIIDPGTAFGAGDHPSTLLNLELLALLMDGRWGALPSGPAADVGAGTGVLALAIALKGAKPVLALDPDPASRRATARNQGLNPLAGPLVLFALADHRCLAGPCALVAANLPGPILKLAGPTMAQALVPGGWLVASGFRQEAGEDMACFFSELGLESQARRTEGGWLALALRK
ncbi:MAG: 50S ribosomal protein L11 methyltransferase [Deltaproteobacteria bacterium]|nr:50S ribosomal protein L11 methyltransferase [Deltaproteobacteria bacterium]